MNEYKIAIVNSSSFGKIFPEHIKALESIGEVKHFIFDQNIEGKRLAEELAGYNIIIASVTPFFTKDFFDHKDELILISRHGIGYNNVDLDAAREHKTIVSIIPALVERDAVAEQNVTNLLNIMRQVSQSTTAVKNDEWEQRAKFVGNTLFNKTVGIIGLGNTGSCVAEIVRNGFRCRVISYDPNKSKLDMDQYGVEKVDLEYLLTNADVICLSASLTDTSYHIINAETISMMKNGVYISNSGRGALVEEQAMMQALKSGKVAGYATDVLEVEPGRANHGYLTFDNVIVTPHTAAYTKECLFDMGSKCVQDVQMVVNGMLPIRSIQPESDYVK